MDDEPNIEDMSKSNVFHNPMKDKNKQPEVKPADYSTFLNEFTDILNKSLDDSDKTLFNLIDTFKMKYQQSLIDSPLPTDIETTFISKFQDHKSFSLSNNKAMEFIQLLFDLYDILPYFYHPLNFSTFKESFEPKDDIDILTLFKSISPLSNDAMNIMIDEMIMFLYENYTDYKALYIQNNLLLNYQSRSVYISFKLICLDIFIYNKMTSTTWNKIIFIESLSNISRILLQEANYYNQKFNNEFYENAFSEFDFNSEDKVKRKLSKDEFTFLTHNLFKFLYLIIKTFTSMISSTFDFSSGDSRNKFWKQVDWELKRDTKEELPTEIFIWYIMMNLICDIIAFIYTNFLYENLKTKDEAKIHIASTNPFKMFEGDWKMPSYFPELLSLMRDEMYLKHNTDNVKFIECFLSLCDIKNQFPDKITSSYEHYSNATYFIFHPVNSVGLSLLIWMLEKDKLSTNYLYSSLYLFDLHLPLIAALIKAEHNLRYIGFEILLNYTQTCQGIVPSMNSLMHYSFDDIFNDVLDFIGGNTSDNKRKYMNSQIPSIIGLLSSQAKLDLFNYYIDTAMTVSTETKNINDSKVSFILLLVKNVLNDGLKKNDLSLFKEDFLKKLIKNFTDYETIFIFEIIETISQALNFIHYIVLIDKSDFQGKLGIYNKDYLYTVDKKLTDIANLVEKFVNSSDEEKYKTLRMNPNDQREDVKHAFNLKKNECLILLNLINTVGKIVMRSLKELSV